MTYPGFDPREELVPRIVDHYAAVQPDHVYAEYPNSPDSYQEGYHKITYRDLANVVNGLAWWLTESLGPGQNCEPLAYIGTNTLIYPAIALAAIKAGYSVSDDSDGENCCV